MCRLLPARPSAPAFQVCQAGRLRPVSYTGFQAFLRKLLACTGRNPTDFSTHSLRRGGATWAFQAGVSGELIQILGDWKSDAYKGYIDVSLEARQAALASMIAGI